MEHLANAAHNQSSVISRIKDLVEKQLNLCVSCGTCRKSCTVLPRLRAEYATARGRLALVDAFIKGEISYSRRLREAFEQCTLCGFCTEACPNHVDPEGVLSISRALVIKPGIIEKGVSMLLSHRKGLNLTALAARLALMLLPFAEKWKKIPSFIPLVGGRIVPAVKMPPQELRQKTYQGYNPRGPRVLFFPGCFVDYAFHNQYLSALKALAWICSEIHTPRNLPCCGLPSLEMGDAGAAHRQASVISRTALELNVDAVVVICGSCGSMFRKVYPLLDPAFERFSQKVKDISELLIEHRNLLRGREKKWGRRIKVCYHHCCHLKRGMGVYSEPEELIQLNPEVEYEELDFPDRCCGFGGTMYVKYASLADEIVSDKVEDIVKHNPDYLALGCPGCLMHIQGALLSKGCTTRCIHPVELIA